MQSFSQPLVLLLLVLTLVDNLLRSSIFWQYLDLVLANQCQGSMVLNPDVGLDTLVDQKAHLLRRGMDCSVVLGSLAGTVGNLDQSKYASGSRYLLRSASRHDPLPRRRKRGRRPDRHGPHLFYALCCVQGAKKRNPGSGLMHDDLGGRTPR